jgi:hypothetical protein
MTEREDKVYQAKLAEQAERYDGKKRIFLHINAICRGKNGRWCAYSITGAFIDLLCFAVLVEKYFINYRCTVDKGYAYLKSGLAKIFQIIYKMMLYLMTNLFV